MIHHSGGGGGDHIVMVHFYPLWAVFRMCAVVRNFLKLSHG